MTNKKTDYFTLRIEKSVKNEFTEFCQRRRLPISRAVTLFVQKVVKEGEIPFDLYGVERDAAEKKDTVMGVYVDGAIRSQFADVCAGYGVSVGTVIRGFMMACVENNNFPYKPSRPKKDEK